MIKVISNGKLNINYMTFVSMLFFLGFVLNEVFGDLVGLNNIPKAVLLMFMVSSCLLLLRKGMRIPVSFFLLLVTNLVWWFFSTFWTPGYTGQISTLAQNILLGFCVYIFFNYYKDFDLLYRAMFFAGIILALYSISVYGIGGFISALQAEERMGYGITNANTYGRVFAYSIVAGLYFALYKNKWWYGLGCILLLLFALSSGSKKSILIIIIGATVLMFFRYGLKYALRFLFGMVAAGAILYFVMQLPIFETAFNRFSLFLSGEQDYSDRVRSSMISVGWDLFCEKPIIGWGLNAYSVVSSFNVYSHNNYIEMLVNFGFVGFVLFYSIYVYILRGLRYSLKLKYSQYVMMFTIIVAILITDYGIVSYALKWSWIIIGVAASMKTNGNKALWMERNQIC